MIQQHLAVLVVEDEALIRMDLAAALEEAGYVVVEASSGLEAIGILARDVPIGAIVTDVDMPGGISGLDLVRMVNLTGRPIPVIVVSGQDRGLEAERAGAAGFFLKPCRMEDLLRRLAGLTEGAAFSRGMSLRH